MMVNVPGQAKVKQNFVMKHPRYIATSRDGTRALTATAFIKKIPNPTLHFLRRTNGGFTTVSAPFSSQLDRGLFDFSARGNHALVGRRDSICELYNADTATL